MAPKKKNSSLYIVLSCFFVICFIFSVTYALKSKQEMKDGQAVYDQLASEAMTTASGDSSESSSESEPYSETETVDPKTQALLDIMPKDFTVNLQTYIDQNEDVYSYIYIPNTYVSYPVLQHPGDDYYYLNHNIDHTKGYPGTIYTESVNQKEWSDPVTLVYGHNMLNGSMFATLHKFEDPDFFDKNRYVYIYDGTSCFIYEIFATVTYSDDHIMKAFDFTYEEEFNRFIQSVYSYRDLNAHYLDDYDITYEDQVIVLSTCCSNANRRFIVCAKKLGSVEY
ncbi:MAG: class B sortase [Lachnospiraceae bacterium]